MTIIDTPAPPTCTAESLKQRFGDKVMTPLEALRRFVKYGQRVFVGSGAGNPQSLARALVHADHLEDLELVHILTLGDAPYVDPEYAGRFRHNALFIGPNVRKAVHQGRADYTPIFLSEIPALFREGQVPLDAALIQVSPPDEHGYCSYGVATDVVKAGAESARFVIAEVNPNAPRALGDSFIHVSRIDALCYNDEPLPELRFGQPDELSKTIARHIADLIENGSTLQLGIGAMPDAVLHFLTSHKDLGVHTEMFSDGLIPLVEKGVINNAKKTLHRGKIVASFIIGTRKLYDFVNNNPLVEFRPTEYTNDPFVVAQHEKMVAINSAIEVDLTGQICADSIGTAFYSGIGGQVDFVRGAARAKDGKPIIALPSTAHNETVSRIVPTLKPGAGVVTSRGDAHYVVTEYGVAYLHGKSMRERAMALIQVAHPKFRPWLFSEAKARNLIYTDQIEPPLHSRPYPDELEHWVELKNHRSVLIRPARLTDEPRLREMFYRLSEETIQHRFFQQIKVMPHARLQEFLRVDYERDMVLVATPEKEEDGPLIAVGRYNLDPRTNLAEVAFLVEDGWQGQGLGGALLRALVRAAKERGIKGFTAEVLQENYPMLRVFHHADLAIETKLEDGVYFLTMRFDGGEQQ